MKQDRYTLEVTELENMLKYCKTIKGSPLYILIGRSLLELIIERRLVSKGIKITTRSKLDCRVDFLLGALANEGKIGTVSNVSILIDLTNDNSSVHFINTTRTVTVGKDIYKPVDLITSKNKSTLEDNSTPLDTFL